MGIEDILEETKKVVESRNATLQNTSLPETKFTKNAKCMNEIKVQLQDLEEQCVKKEQVLEISDYAKNTLNEETMALRKKAQYIYQCLQGLYDECNEMENEQSILEEKLVEEEQMYIFTNTEGAEALETLLNEKSALVTDLKKRSDEENLELEKIKEENASLENELQTLMDENKELMTLIETCKSQGDVVNNTKCTLEETVNFFSEKIKCVENDTENLMKLIKEEEIQYNNKGETISNEVASLNDEIADVEKKYIKLTNILQENLAHQHKVLTERNAILENYDRLKSMCSNLKESIDTLDAKLQHKDDDDVNVNCSDILEINGQTETYEEMTVLLKKDLSEVTAKNATLNQEIDILNSKLNDMKNQKCQTEKNSAILLIDNSILDSNVNQLSNEVSNVENTLKLLEEQLDQKKINDAAKLSKIKESFEQQFESFKHFRDESNKILEEIQRTDSNNEIMKENVVKLEQILKDLNSDKDEILSEKLKELQYDKEINTIIDFNLKELKNLNNYKAQLEKDLRAITKRAPIQSKIPLAKRHALFEESDSSIDSDKVLLTELIKRKRHNH